MKFDAPVDSIAFLMADSREAAVRIGRTLVAVLHGVGLQDVSARDVLSFGELVRAGANDDRDLRVFEIAAANDQEDQWTFAPYFLTDDSSLLGKWAELRADVAANIVRSAVRRAR